MFGFTGRVRRWNETRTLFRAPVQDIVIPVFDKEKNVMAYKIHVDCPRCLNDIDFEVVIECDGAMWAREAERFCDCEVDEETMEKLENEAIQKVCED